MRVSLLVRGCIALSAALGSAGAIAAQPEERPTPLPNAADPKPAAAGGQGAGQTVVVSLEKRSVRPASAAPGQRKAPAGHEGTAAPFAKPKPN